MPHLQEKEIDNKHHLGAKGAMSMPPQSELPIQEARIGYLNGTEGLPTMSVTSKIQNSPVKVESFGSTDEAPRRSVSEDASMTPQPNAAKQSVITPSPFGTAGQRGMRSGVIMTIFGNKKLVPSPIRVKRRAPTSADDNEGGSSRMSQPTNLRYADPYSTPVKGALANEISDGSEDENPKKRLLAQLERDESISKKSKEDRAESPEYTLAETGAVNDDTAQSSPQPNVLPKKKKALISPTSSGEKGEDDQSTGTETRGVGYPPYGPRGYAHPHYPPHRHAYGPPPGYGPPPAYPGGYPIYAGYPPPHPGHFMHAPPRAPQAPFYPPYPPHHPGMMRHFPRGHASPGKFPPAFLGTRSLHGKPGMLPITSEAPKQGPVPTESAIKSVAEWQQAALSTGKPPSANRCVPLNEPIPSKYWGNAEKTKDVILADFHRLVNFPDYLAKSRSSSGSESNSTPCGKKNCVMCGKLRVCSASSRCTSAGSGVSPETQEEVTSMPVDDDDSTAHIIPRQNKGLCTACDVSVWVVVTDGLEIKWCKGCKNFRPWAAFGDKGSATKCVRCRDRQREKYAMQKDEIRVRRFKRSNSSSPSSDDEKPVPTPGGDDDTQMAAARGLRNLINAASV